MRQDALRSRDRVHTRVVMEASIEASGVKPLDAPDGVVLLRGALVPAWTPQGRLMDGAAGDGNRTRNFNLGKVTVPI
jgi:hypothetical protein